MEALICHPLDTIKVRMQLSRRKTAPGQKARGFYATGQSIVQRETVFGLYKGLGAVMTGIVPKMAIRFTAYEWYKQLLADQNGHISSAGTFTGMFPLFCLLSLLTTRSRSRSWSHRSCGSRDTHGSRQDSNAGAISLFVRPSRCAEVSKCSSCCSHSPPRRRRQCLVAWCVPHSPPTGHEPSCQFHCLHRTEGDAAKISTTI